MFEIIPDRYPLLIAFGTAALLLWYLAYRLTKPLVRRVITRSSLTPAREFWLRLFDPRSDSEILGVFQKLGLRTGEAAPVTSRGVV
ncbi:hypothetical protein IHV82_01245 [Mycobacterium avium]|nr:hypothetical protein IHV82_01245 [Mycobacterium avium]